MLDRRMLRSVLWEILAPLMRVFVAHDASVNRREGAAAMGIGETLFDELAKEPGFPKPWVHGKTKRWLKSKLLAWQHGEHECRHCGRGPGS